MQSALADVAGMLLLPGTVGSLVGQVTRALVGALRERRQSVRALAGCRRLADCHRRCRHALAPNMSSYATQQ